MLRYFLLLSLLFCTADLYSQYTYKGIVTDGQTKEPLPFVNVTGDDQKQGTVSDIDGEFIFNSASRLTELHFFYIGYEPATYLIKSDTDPSSIRIALKRKPVGLKEVIVVAGENPAHRIINLAISNREKNDPENLEGFSYESYNKFVVTADSLEKVQSQKMDTSLEAAKAFFRSNHLFLSESVTKRYYRYKGLSNETVLASRVSGLKSPLFTLLGTQFQSFTFYKDHITVSDKNYLNPLSPNSTRKYIFILEDTTYSGSDTIYQISFQPRAGKNFDGLKGVLYINTHGYAIQNVIAEPFEDVATKVKIQQLYSLTEGRWFPVQLNSDLIFGTLSINGRPVKGNARTYLSAIRIGDQKPKSEFSEITVDVDKDALNRDEEFWNRYRKDSLTVKDKKTYQVIDSIGKEAKLEEKLLVFNSFLTGRYPVGKLDLDLNRIIDYNRHEEYRIGAGIYTNNRISKLVTAGGYFAYGTGDDSWKYGASVSARVKGIKDGILTVEYINDVTESGNKGEFLRKQSLLAEDYRRLSVNMMDKIESYSVSAGFRWLKYLHSSIVLEHWDRLPLYVQNESKLYSATEIKAQFRYVYKEKFIRLLGDPISLGSDKPVFWFSCTKGLKGILNGQYEYIRTDMMIKDQILIRNTGTFNYTVKAGDLTGVKGLPFAYHLRGSYLNWALFDDESFQTMGINEFFTTRYLNVFIRHDFGTLLFKTKYFSPSLGITSAIGFIKEKAEFDKPFMESGLLLQDIIKVSFMKLGLGGFYRYGYHHLKNEPENFTVKTIFRIAF